MASQLSFYERLRAGLDARPASAQQHAVASLDLPADVLDVILKFSDLRTRYVAVQVCHEFCDSITRLSPNLEWHLLLKRFPLLEASIDAEVKARGRADVEGDFKTVVPRLFQTYSRFEADNDDAAPEVVPTAGLDNYTLALELELIDHGGSSKRSVFVGTGELLDTVQDRAKFAFDVDDGVFAEAYDLLETDQPPSVRARIVATRRNGGRIQHARLFCGHHLEREDDCVLFPFRSIPRRSRSAGQRWLANRIQTPPGLRLFWYRHEEDDERQDAPSTLTATFTWNDDFVDQSPAEACLTLEHWVDWEYVG